MRNAFAFRNVVKTYRDFQLGPLNLDLEPGVVLGYVGPNASGKTTTMHCLVGLVRAEAGEMEIFGRRNDLNHPEWKLDLGYVGDEHVFYENWTSPLPGWIPSCAPRYWKYCSRWWKAVSVRFFIPRTGIWRHWARRTYWNTA